MSSEALSSGIAARETIHEWPLSCVQRVVLEDGTRLVYKSQLPPTVEPQFYEAATSDLLPGYRLLGKLGDCDTMVLDWIEAPLLRDAVSSEAEVVEHGRRVIARIGAIGGRLPTYLDVGSADAWGAVVETTLEKLRTLVLNGRFQLTTLDAVRRVRAWLTSARVIAAVTAHPRLAHGDLTAGQLFVTTDGYRVIDWQRPVIAPPEIDLVALPADRGLEPRRYVDPTLVGAFWLLHLHWAVYAQSDLFANARGEVFDQWSARAVREILA